VRAFFLDFGDAIPRRGNSAAPLKEGGKKKEMQPCLAGWGEEPPPGNREWKVSIIEKKCFCLYFQREETGKDTAWSHCGSPEGGKSLLPSLGMLTF